MSVKSRLVVSIGVNVTMPRLTTRCSHRFPAKFEVGDRAETGIDPENLLLRHDDRGAGPQGQVIVELPPTVARRTPHPQSRSGASSHLTNRHNNRIERVVPCSISHLFVRPTSNRSDCGRRRPAGCKSREPILPNRPTAHCGGGSLHAPWLPRRHHHQNLHHGFLSRVSIHSPDSLRFHFLGTPSRRISVPGAWSMNSSNSEANQKLSPRPSK